MRYPHSDVLLGNKKGIKYCHRLHLGQTLKSVRLSEKSQIQETVYCMIHLYEVSNKDTRIEIECR